MGTQSTWEPQIPTSQKIEKLTNGQKGRKIGQILVKSGNRKRNKRIKENENENYLCRISKDWNQITQ